MKLPERWLFYEKCARIKNTPFVACKTPLRSNYSNKLSPVQSFTPKKLLEKHPRIKLVIDLTNTYKYYDGNREFVANGVHYIKIRMKGCGVIPDNSKFTQFVKIVDQFLLSNPKDHLIAVHCTHGVNRTGYFIVRYMIEKMGYSNEAALKEFFQSRGHAVDRIALVIDLLKRNTVPQEVMQNNTSIN